jgi:hypothetical protein
MKKIKITEAQAAKLGLKRINEADDSGLKSAGIAMGELVVRIVVSGNNLSSVKDRVLGLIHRQDPDSTVAYFDATGKIVGNIKEIKRKAIERDLQGIDPSIKIEKKAITSPKLKEGVANIVKISKEQYNRLFASGLINENEITGGLDRVDKTFKKEFAGKNVQNLKPVAEDKFNISKPNKSIPTSTQKFGKPIMEGEDSQLKSEIMELIKYLYRKSEELSPYWKEHGISYDDLCSKLKNKGIIISKNGKYELSKKLGSPEQAISALENEIKTLLPTEQSVETTEAYPMRDAPQTDAPLTDAPSLESENYPAGTEHDSSAPWNKQEPSNSSVTKPKETKLEPIASNKEIVLFKGPDGSLYVFYYDSMNKEELYPYASVPRTYAGKDEDGAPEYEYDYDQAVIDGEVIGHYVNDNLAHLSKGDGLEAYEKGVDLVKLDEPLKKELASLYDKDKSIAKVLGPIEEVSSPEDAVNNVRHNVKQASTPKSQSGETPEAKQSRIVSKLQQLKQQEKSRQDNEASEIEARRTSAKEVDEMTSAASSGAFTGAFATEPIKKEMPVPVVGETTAGSGSMGAYDANALPGIGRNGEFKGSKKTKAETTPQWAGGSFVKQPVCSKLDNNKSAENGGCNQGASSLRTVKAKGSINAPSLGENEIFEAIAKKTGKTIDEIKRIIASKK